MHSIALIRHGSFVQPTGVPSAHLPHPLDELGRKQADEKSRELLEFVRKGGYSVDPVIDSSALLRAYETATIFARVFAEGGIPLEVEEFPDLAERCLGAAANLSLEEIDAVFAADPRLDPLPEGWKAKTDFRLPLLGAESLWQAGERVANHIRRRTEECKGGPEEKKLKLFIGHGGAFRHGAMHLEILAKAEVQKLSMWHCAPVLFQLDEEGRWQPLAGQWKVRPSKQSDDV